MSVRDKKRGITLGISGIIFPFLEYCEMYLSPKYCNRNVIQNIKACIGCWVINLKSIEDNLFRYEIQ